MYVLVINCGSTSTKMALFDEGKALRENVIRYEIDQIPKTKDEDLSLRMTGIEAFADECAREGMTPACVACRGGAFYPVNGGAYRLDENLVAALTETCKHSPDNYSGIIGFAIAKKRDIPAYIYDAVTVDELTPVARYSGVKGADRYSRTHTLNTRAAAIAAAAESGRDYKELNIITAHMGGGVSVNVYEKGRLSDLVTAEEGGFSAERCGGLAGDTVLELLQSRGSEELEKLYHGNGGLVSYFQTNSALEVEKRIADGDEEAAVIFEAMAYQVAKSIGAMAVAVNGQVDLIVLSGGMLRSEKLQQWITKRVAFLAPVKVYPGEMEMAALAQGVLRAVRGEEQTQFFCK